MSYLEKVAPAEAKRLANPEKNQMRIVKGADQ
jgi:hypothetical protein